MKITIKEAGSKDPKQVASKLLLQAETGELLDTDQPVDMSAKDFMRQLVAQACANKRANPQSLSVEDVLRLADPTEVGEFLDLLERRRAVELKAQKARAQRAARSRSGKGSEYTIRHVYSYGDDEIRDQALRATDAYDALWKAASAVSDNALIDAKDMFRSVAAMRHYPLHSVFNWINELASEEGAGYIMAVIGPDGKSVLEDGAYVDGEYSQSAADENPGCWSTESGSRKFYDLEGSFYDDVDDADKAEDED